MKVSRTFRFWCVRNLLKNLGEVDSTVECTELAIREFISQIKIHPKIIQELSSKQKIKVDDVDIESLNSRTSQLFIVSVYQQAEGFLEDFRDEHPNSKNWKYEKKDDLFTRIIKNLTPNFIEAKKDIGNLEIDLFEYYRLIRNRFMHLEIDESHFENKAQRLKEIVKSSPNYSRLNAPNTYNEISFDDFILFTRIIKHLAFQLSIVGRPTDEEIALNVINMIRCGKASIKIQSIKKLGSNTSRLDNALVSYLCEVYGLGKDEGKPIAELIKNDLLT